MKRRMQKSRMRMYVSSIYVCTYVRKYYTFILYNVALCECPRNILHVHVVYSIRTLGSLPLRVSNENVHDYESSLSNKKREKEREGETEKILMRLRSSFVLRLFAFSLWIRVSHFLLLLSFYPSFQKYFQLKIN